MARGRWLAIASVAAAFLGCQQLLGLDEGNLISGTGGTGGSSTSTSLGGATSFVTGTTGVGTTHGTTGVEVGVTANTTSSSSVTTAGSTGMGGAGGAPVTTSPASTVASTSVASTTTAATTSVSTSASTTSASTTTAATTTAATTTAATTTAATTTAATTTAATTTAATTTAATTTAATTTTATTTTAATTTAATTTAATTTAATTSSSSSSSSGGATGLSVLYRVANPMASTPQISPSFEIANGGTHDVAYAGLTLRYYFTADGSTNLVGNCDYAMLTCSQTSPTAGIVGWSFGTIQATNADHYLELNFAKSTGVIGAGGNSGEIQMRIHDVNNAINFVQGNDYSYDGTKTAYAAWNKVTLYQNGVLIWGTEPK